MHLYVSVDLEGVLGVTSPHQCFPTPADPTGYHHAVAQLVAEVTVVLNACQHHGVQHVTVNDAHGYMANLRPQQLPPWVTLITGKPKRCAMSAGLTPDMDAMLMLGYHSKVGTLNGVLCHTFHDQVFDCQINGVSYGEGGINMLYASMVHGVPAVLVSGDDAVCQELQALLPTLVTVPTKQGLSFSAAQHRPWQQVQQQYQQAVGQAIQTLQTGQPVARLTLPPPYHLQVTLATTQAADIACLLPTLQRVDGRTVAQTLPDMGTLYQTLQTIYALLAYPATPAASHLD
jgi:D-amino peptidase